MAATVPLKDLLHAHVPGWTLFVNGVPLSPGTTDWKVVSRFGSVQNVVVLHADGTPNFDRPEYREAESVNVVAWGMKDGELYMAVVHQPRPHADDPEQPGVNGHAPIVFGQIAMGFVDKIFGESVDAAMKRETHEETGASVIIKVERPPYPYHNQSPAFVATWPSLYFVQVDLAKIEELRPDRDEPIFGAQFMPAWALVQMIASGKVGDTVYRMAMANSAWMIFFACHPELFPRYEGDDSD